MDHRTEKREILRMFSDGTIKAVNDDMIVEKRMILEVDGSREAVVIFTPGDRLFADADGGVVLPA